MTTDTNIVPRLKTVYNDEIRGKLLTELGLSNVMEVPRLEKIVINVGCGAAVDQMLYQHLAARLVHLAL